MRNRKYLFVAILISIFYTFQNSFAQTNGEVIYKTVLEKEKFNEVDSRLIFNGDVSLFIFAHNKNESKTTHAVDHDVEDIENAVITFAIEKPLSNYEKVFIDRKNDEVISTDYFYQNRKFRKCTIQESTGLFAWTITGKRKEHGSYTAHEALTTFRGRNYKAWFTYDIPVDAGPWKFHGLPGLILEVTDEELGVQFYATSIEIPTKRDFEIKTPDEGIIMTIEDFAKTKENVEEEFIDLIKSKLPRGVSASFSTTKKANRNIEREY